MISENVQSQKLTNEDDLQMLEKRIERKIESLDTKYDSRLE